VGLEPPLFFVGAIGDAGIGGGGAVFRLPVSILFPVFPPRTRSCVAMALFHQGLLASLFSSGFFFGFRVSAPSRRARASAGAVAL